MMIVLVCPSSGSSAAVQALLRLLQRAAPLIWALHGSAWQSDFHLV